MKRKYLLITSACLLSFLACKSPVINPIGSFWGELEENQNYLYQADSLTAIVDGEINAGSVLLFGEEKGDFYEVYVSKSSKKKRNGKLKYYLYKPKVKKLGHPSSSYSQKFNYASVEGSRTYQIGARGGCYYINSKGNRIYVDKAFCNLSNSVSPSTYDYAPKGNNSNPKSSGGDIHVKGHYRANKSGKTIYVKPHTRKRN